LQKPSSLPYLERLLRFGSGVAVKNGVVTLTGFVRSYSQKRQAEADAKRVAGVLGLANDIEVRLPVVSRRPDPEIARDAVATIQMELPYSYEHIKVVVNEGWVTLEGEVEWHYQRERAEDAVQRLRGVKGISNLIRVKPKIVPADIKHKIEEAFRRSAEIDANRITVEARSPSKAPYDRGPNVKRPNESPGRRRASRRWTTGSPSARKTVAGGRVDGGWPDMT
jgi:osmotically-inducible protein OsmY